MIFLIRNDGDETVCLTSSICADPLQVLQGYDSNICADQLWIPHITISLPTTVCQIDFVYNVCSMEVYSSRWQHLLDKIFFQPLQLIMLVSVTPPYSCKMAENGKNFSAGEVLEAIFQGQDSHGEQFDCGSDLEMFEDSEESEYDSD